MNSPTSRNQPQTRRPWLSATVALAGVLVLCTALYAITTVWTRTTNGSANQYDAGWDAVSAPNRDLYVVGAVNTTGEGQNIWIRKYDSSGTKLWTRTLDGPAGQNDRAAGAALDSGGNLYVVGQIRNSDSLTDIWIRKYTSSGGRLWTRIVNGSANGSDWANAAAVDSSDNLFVAGMSEVRNKGSNIWIRKYDPSGSTLWTRRVAGSAGNLDQAMGAAVDSSDNLLVVGTIYDTNTFNDIWIRKYTTSGDVLWTRTVDGPSGLQDFAGGVAVDGNDNIFVVGTVYSTTSEDNIWIRKYDSSGTKRWTRIVTSNLTFSNDRAHDATVDANGAVYVAAQKQTSSVSLQAWTRKYSSTGLKRWTATYSGPANYALAFGIAIDANKRVCVTGSVDKSGEGGNIFVRKYRQ